MAESSALSEQSESKGYHKNMWFLYMIKNSADKLYVGVTQSPKDRVTYHNQKCGASFTKHIPTYKIVFLEKYVTLAEARRREIQIKK